MHIAADITYDPKELPIVLFEFCGKHSTMHIAGWRDKNTKDIIKFLIEDSMNITTEYFENLIRNSTLFDLNPELEKTAY